MIDYYKIRGVNKGLFALALGTFALGITEFLMMGILCVGAPVVLFARKFKLKTIMCATDGVAFVNVILGITKSR